MSWPVHISPLSCANMNNYWLENRKIPPSTSSFFASILQVRQAASSMYQN
jgi:hypothetical protein